MSMTEHEISILIKKLRSKYSEYSSKHSPRWFDLEAFEDRYRMAVQKRMNLEGFILAEITNFEKIKERYEKKKSTGSFSQKIEKIMEENLERVKKYPPIDFHGSADVEIRHLYGGLSVILTHDLPVLWTLIRDKQMKDLFIELEDRIDYLAAPKGNLYSKRIESHINVLRRPGVVEIDIEKDRNDYLKECAFVLHDLSEFCSRLLLMRDPEWESPVQFDRVFLDESRKKNLLKRFSGLTGYGVIVQVQESCNSLIEDFRLQAFRRT